MQFFAFWLPWQPDYWLEFNLLNNSGRASPKEHPCQVSSRLAQWFRRRRCLKKLWMTDVARQTTDIGRSQKLTMSTSCSGELKTHNLFYRCLKRLCFFSCVFFFLGNFVVFFRVFFYLCFFFRSRLNLRLMKWAECFTKGEIALPITSNCSFSQCFQKPCSGKG